MKNTVYYVIAQSSLGLIGEKLDKPDTILYVTDSIYFDKNGFQSDYMPKWTIEELSRLGYEASEIVDAVLDIRVCGGTRKTFDLENINEWAKELIDEGSPANVEELKQKLASSKLFKFSPSFQKFIMEHGDGEEYNVVVPL